MFFVALEDGEGLILAPGHAIASFTPEFASRWRAVLADGTVAHGPEPAHREGWRQLAGSWVRPELLSASPLGWRDPADFLLGPLVSLPDLPPLSAPSLPGLSFSLAEVVSLEAHSGYCVWHTERGSIKQVGSAVSLAGGYPELVLVARGIYVNLLKVIWIRPDPEQPGRRFLILSGSDRRVVARIHVGRHRAVARRFGLAHFFYLEPRDEALARWRLRDWPLVLSNAKAAYLRAHFRCSEVLIMNVVWQIVRQRKQGLEVDFPGDYRGLFYDALYATLFRAGFMTRAKTLRAIRRSGLATEDELYSLYLRLVAQAVGEDRLFTFRELGLDDPGEHLVHFGDRHPDVVVVAEKSSLEENLVALRQKYGVTTLVTSGQAKLLPTEYFAASLKERGLHTVRLIAYVDFDPAGWTIPRVLTRMLERYGIKVLSLRYLVRAKHFTAEEVELFSVPLPTKTATMNKKWLVESGGFDGRALGMHCSHLRPQDRVLAAFAEVF